MNPWFRHDPPNFFPDAEWQTPSLVCCCTFPTVVSLILQILDRTPLIQTAWLLGFSELPSGQAQLAKPTEIGRGRNSWMPHTPLGARRKMSGPALPSCEF